MGWWSDFVDVLLIVIVGTYYTVSEINFIEKLLHWRTGDPSANEAKALIRATKRTGSVAVVTGANGGLGLEIARNLVTVGYTVIMACRSKSNATQAIDDIRKTQPDAKLDFIPLDLSSFESVTQFVEQLKTKDYKIDLLINNAGLMFTEYTLTKDGFEMQMGVNHLGHFKLTMLMLPLLAPRSRILTVTSITSRSGTINLDDLNSVKSYSKFRGYCNSKLANVYFTKELARRLRESKSDIISVGINPGSVATNIVGGAAMPWWLGKLYSVFGAYLLKTPFEGASSAIFAALSDRIGRDEFQSGAVLFESKKDTSDPVPDPNSPEANRIGKKLWELSEELTCSAYPLSNAQ